MAENLLEISDLSTNDSDLNSSDLNVSDTNESDIEIEKISSKYNKRTKNVDIRLQITPLASTKPKSLPIVKLINTSARSPTTVVTLLLETDEKELYNASFIALVIFFSFSLA